MVRGHCPQRREDRGLDQPLEATDVAAVHAGYAKRRKPLLELACLYESRRQRGGSKPKSGFAGSSDTSLHAKTFAVDGLRVFVGSFNFDPRSAHLTPSSVSSSTARPWRARSKPHSIARYRRTLMTCGLSQSGDLYWLERHGEQVLRTDIEPGTGFWQRAGVWLLSMLPIERLL